MRKNIVVTLPASIEWSEYVEELKAAENGAILNFKVGHLPKDVVGVKCYLVHRGRVVGWMNVVGVVSGGFKCTTTGKWWDGNFIQRSGKFYYINGVPMKGFQGFRYVDF